MLNTASLFLSSGAGHMFLRMRLHVDQCWQTVSISEKITLLSAILKNNNDAKKERRMHMNCGGRNSN